ncbi:methyl-accepting chemotaxis protein [Hippea jasoniae]|uniref:methyl-accepting chemotaxis protein n=1 Tax=Hippea jasoniae TaxID=944479 RepID=UPI000553AAF5|nr:methyl-accepting chemotaxis protein [Hippea jasoniae]
MKNVSLGKLFFYSTAVVFIVSIILIASNFFIATSVKHHINHTRNIDLATLKLTHKITVGITETEKLINRALRDKYAKAQFNSVVQQTESYINKAIEKEKANPQLHSELNKLKNVFINMVDTGKKVMTNGSNSKDKTIEAFDSYVDAIGEISQQIAEAEAKIVSSQLLLIGKETVDSLIFVTIGLLIILGLIIGLYFVVKHYIIIPILNANEKTLKLAEGDFTSKFEVITGNEIGKLKSGINTVIDSMRKLIGQMKSEANELSSHANSLSSTATEISATVEQTARNTEELGTAVKDIVEAIDNVAKSTEHVNMLAEEMGEVNGDILNDIIDRVERMRNNAKLAQEAMEQINTVGDASKQIGQIVGVISEIADQTNLLALNAAIEAARAGDAGRGFAVVADEVRKLAEKTQRATEEIRNMIAKMQTDANIAVEKTQKAGDMILNEAEKSQEDKKKVEAVVEKANGVIEELNSVSAATEELSSTAAEIDAQVNEIVEASQENAKAVEEIARISEKVNEMSNKITEAVSIFKV